MVYLFLLLFGLATGTMIWYVVGGQRGRTIWVGFAVIPGLLWTLSGVALIIGGFPLIGVFVMTVFFFLTLSNLDRFVRQTTGKGLRQRIGGQ